MAMSNKSMAIHPTEHMQDALQLPQWQTLKGHRSSVNTLACDEAVHPQSLFSGSDDGTCRLWDLRTARTARSLCVFKALGLHSPQELQDQDASVNSIAIDANGHDVHVACGNRLLSFDLRQEQLVVDHVLQEILQHNDDEINHLRLHGNHSRNGLLAAPDDNGDIRLYDMHQHKLAKSLCGQHTNLCTSAVFRPNSPWDLVSGGMDGVVLFWDCSRGRVRYRMDMNELCNQPDVNSNTNSSGTTQLCNPPLVHFVEFATNGKHFVAALGDGSIVVVDFKTRRIVSRHKQHQALVSQVHFPAFKPSEWLVSTGNDAKVIIWDFAQLQNTKEPTQDQEQEGASDPAIVKHFDVPDKPNAISSSSFHNWLHVADMSNDITCYPVL